MISVEGVNFVFFLKKKNKVAVSFPRCEVDFLRLIAAKGKVICVFTTLLYRAFFYSILSTLVDLSYTYFFSNNVRVTYTLPDLFDRLSLSVP